MDMIGHAPDAVTVDADISRHGGKVGVKGWPDRYIEQGRAVLCAEDNMGDKQGQGLRHGFLNSLNGAGFQPWGVSSYSILGRCPRLGYARAFGADTWIFNILEFEGGVKYGRCAVIKSKHSLVHGLWQSRKIGDCAAITACPSRQPCKYVARKPHFVT